MSGGADATIKIYNRENLGAFLATTETSSNSDDIKGQGGSGGVVGAEGGEGGDTQFMEELMTKELPIEKTIELHDRPVTCLAANHVLYDYYRMYIFTIIFLR